jgi:hypothetical protein
MLRLLDNPITQAEGRYQRRSTGSKWRLPIRAALYLALVIALILIGGAFVNALARQGTRSLVETLTLPALMLGIITLATYVWMPVQALMLASESIGREKRLGTWETLLLAGVDAGQIVRGKWWATMRHIWPDFLLAGVLRLGVMTWIGLFFAIDGSRPLPVYADPLAMLLSGAIAILLSVVSAGLATTCGLLASLMSQRSGTVLAMMLYIVVLLAVVIVLGLGAHFFNW